MADFDNSFLSDNDHAAVHEDALVFSINGQPIGWRASGLSLKRASDEEGLEAGEILADLQKIFSADFDEEDLEEMSEEEVEEAVEVDTGITDFYDLVATVTWLGTLHFEPGAKKEVILGMLDAESVGDVPLDRMLQKIFPALEEETEDEGKGKGKTEASES